jgi:hypothetical protein
MTAQRAIHWKLFLTIAIYCAQILIQLNLLFYFRVESHWIGGLIGAATGMACFSLSVSIGKFCDRLVPRMTLENPYIVVVPIKRRERVNWKVEGF